ncbi:MAG: AAA family ATPase, partial [Cetobacterium sp.]
MIIQEIELKDFRPFYGIQKITLSEDLEKNITFINAENGSGKTTLLEAIKWCLYGTINLPNRTEFVNKKTGDSIPLNSDVTVSVKVTFRDEESTYIATRQLELTKKGQTHFTQKNQQELILIKRSKNGISQKISAPQIEISKIIPREMNFFFDGERLADFEDKSTLKKAIEGILGVETINNAIRHLKLTKKNIEQELKNLQLKLGNTTAVQLRDKASSLEYIIDKNKSEIVSLNQEISFAKNQLKDKEDKRQAIKSIEDFAKQKKIKEDKLGIISTKIKDQEAKIRNHYSANSYMAPMTKLINDAFKILQEKKKKKEVPSKVSEFLIEELLQNKKCICGCEIELNSERYRTLEELKKSSSSDKMIEAFDLSLRLTESDKIKRGSFYENLKSYIEVLERLNSEKDDLDREIFELDKKIDKNQNEEGQLLKISIDE